MSREYRVQAIICGVTGAVMIGITSNDFIMGVVGIALIGIAGMLFWGG